MVVSKARQAAIAKICRQYPHAPRASLARKVHREYPAWFETLNAAETAIRYHLGQRGSKSKAQAERRGTLDSPRSSSPLPGIPRSLAKPWLPFIIKGPLRALVLSDIHFPFHDRQALELSLEHGDTIDPNLILLNGDVNDFPGISRYLRDPRGPTLRQELQMVHKFLTHLRLRFPNARIVWKEGNHEERWFKFLCSRAPEILDIVEFAWQTWAGVVENKVEVVGEQRIIMLGHLPVLHGHELPKGMTNPVNPARGAFLRALDCLLMGHQHRTSDHTEETMLGRIIVCRSSGCLCDRSPEYSRINRWNAGFATVVVDKSGAYDVNLKRIVKGKIH